MIFQRRLTDRQIVIVLVHRLTLRCFPEARQHDAIDQTVYCSHYGQCLSNYCAAIIVEIKYQWIGATAAALFLPGLILVERDAVSPCSSVTLTLGMSSPTSVVQ